MNPRQERGLQIAQTKTIQEGIDGWVVPSQTSNKKYFVHKDLTCSCPDCKKNNFKCKHAFAVEYYLQKITTAKDGSIKIENKRLTYPQAWKAYDKSQQEEKSRFLELLNDLLESVEEPDYIFGRPKISQKDLLFSSALKVYVQFSLRRFMSDLKEAKQKNFVQKKPCFASVGHFMQGEELTPVLKRLIELSALPLQSVESKFAVDSTGFRTTKFNEYCKEKHDTKKEHKWLKLHAICGTQTNIITACTVLDENSSDCLQFAPLVNTTASNGFEIKEASGDLAYSSRNNVGLIDSLGGVAYIPFKKSATGKPKGKTHMWRKMFHYFKFNQEEFLAHYHARSNIESTFNMLKAKFNDLLKSKTNTSQTNELLLKVLCHNIVVLIHETNELGIPLQFN